MDYGPSRWKTAKGWIQSWAGPDGHWGFKKKLRINESADFLLEAESVMGHGAPAPWTWRVNLVRHGDSDLLLWKGDVAGGRHDSQFHAEADAEDALRAYLLLLQEDPWMSFKVTGHLSTDDGLELFRDLEPAIPRLVHGLRPERE